MLSETLEKMLPHPPQLHPHLCRYTFAVRYLINGEDVFTLQKNLRNETLEMIRKYLYLASGDVKDKHRLFSPIDRLGYRQVQHGRKPESQILWLKYFLDGYRLPRLERRGLVTRMIEFAIHDTAGFARSRKITPETKDPEPLWLMSWQIRAADWMLRHRSHIENSI